ncbi:alpha/beta-hydrolase [Marasmius fiardii PR-910]|nr:alpha/beta-hydrolase [Marasmius fiardii PR-910]
MASRESVQIPSADEGVFLDVWLYKPAGDGPFPVVIAGHGMTVIKEAGLAPFGERWANDAGYASLIFDYRYFGKSGGEPRNLVDLKKQLEDYQSVIRWARQRPELFVNNKIVVMGSALSGLSVASLVLHDNGLAGGMAHSPMLDGYATVMSSGFRPRLLFWAAVDSIKAKLGLSPIFIKTVGRPNDFALLNTPSALNGFNMMFSQGGVPFSEHPNLINPRTVFELMGSRPGIELKNAHCKILVVSSTEDDMIPIEIGRSIAAAAPEKVVFVEADGGHFDIMKGGRTFDTNINAQISFLKGL